MNKDAWGSSQYESNITVGFNIGSPSLIDIRLVLSKQQMLAMEDATMPPKYFALCSDNNRLYYYDKSAEYHREKLSDEDHYGKFTAVCVNLQDVVDSYGHSIIEWNEQRGIFEAKLPFIASKTNQLENNGAKGQGGTKFVTVPIDYDSTSLPELMNIVIKKTMKKALGTAYDLKDLKKIAFTSRAEDLEGLHVDARDVTYTNSENEFYQHVLNEGAQHGNVDELTVEQALHALSYAFTRDDVNAIHINNVVSTKARDYVPEGQQKQRVGDSYIELGFSDLLGDLRDIPGSDVVYDLLETVNSEGGLTHQIEELRHTVGPKLTAEGALEIDNNVICLNTSGTIDQSTELNVVDVQLGSILLSDVMPQSASATNRLATLEDCTGEGTTNYEMLSNKPSVNGQELVGDVTIDTVSADDRSKWDGYETSLIDVNNRIDAIIDDSVVSTSSAWSSAKAQAEMNVLVDEVTGKRYKLVIVNGVLGTEEING